MKDISLPSRKYHQRSYILRSWANPEVTGLEIDRERTIGVLKHILLNSSLSRRLTTRLPGTGTGTASDQQLLQLRNRVRPDSTRLEVKTLLRVVNGAF
jgi:hypothetical protein